MNLAFFSTPTGWGGGENLLAQLMLGLRRRGERVSLAAPTGSAIAEWATHEAVPLLTLPGRGRSPAAMWRFRRWLAAGAFDAVLLNDPHAITYGGLAAAGLGVPRVGVRHTVFPVRSAWKHNRLLERVVAVSGAAQDGCLTAGVDRDRVVVIHGGVDPATPETKAIDAARERFAASPAPAGPNVLALGSLLPVKGFATLVHAVAKSPTPWRLWIAGEGPERRRLETLADELGVADRVTLLGFRDDAPALLAAADAFVSASHNEGLSLVLVEAMLAGAPIAATPVGGAREVLRMTAGQSDSPYAVTFTPGDPAGAVRAIDSALATPDTTTAAARRWALERFTLDRMAADYAELFARLAGPEAPRAAA